MDKFYDDVIMDHINHARNYREVADAQRKAEAVSRLCGDSVTVYVKLEGEHIGDVGFQCTSCAISMAAASIMTQTVKGKSQIEAKRLSSAITGAIDAGHAPQDAGFDPDQAAIFATLKEFPSRKTCATVAWHALDAALNGDTEPVAVG